MIWDIFTNMLVSFGGSVSFALLYNVPKKYYAGCGFAGMCGWMTYLLVERGTSFTAGVASFFGAFVMVLISRILSVCMKCPITLFVVPGLTPLVPGVGIYFTTYYIVTNDLSQAVQRGIGSIKVAFGLVVGIAIVLSIPRQVFQKKYWVQRKIRKDQEKQLEKVD